MKKEKLKTQPEWMCKYAIPYANSFASGIVWRCGYKEFMRSWIIPRDINSGVRGCFSSECAYNNKNSNVIKRMSHCGHCPTCPLSENGECVVGRKFCNSGMSIVSLVPHNEWHDWDDRNEGYVRCTMNNEPFWNSHNTLDGNGDFVPSQNTHMSVAPGGCPMYVKRTPDEVRELLYRIYNKTWDMWAGHKYCGLCAASTFRPSSTLLAMEEYSGFHMLSEWCKRAMKSNKKRKQKERNSQNEIL